MQNFLAYMEKRYGAKKRDDQLMRIGEYKWELIYGYGTDGTMSWDWRKRYLMRKPTFEEIKSTITELINRNVDEKILSGMTYNGHQVWLSTENQLNYKAAYDLAVLTEGRSLPVRFKFGTDEEPCYHTFESVEELGDFYALVVKHIQNALDEGWTEKDTVDWSKFKT